MGQRPAHVGARPAGVPWAGARGRAVGWWGVSVAQARRSHTAPPRGGRGWAPMMLPPRLMAGGSPRVPSGAARRCGLLRSTDRRGRPAGAAAASPPHAPGRRRAAASRPAGLSCAGMTGLGGGSSRQETESSSCEHDGGPGAAPASMDRRLRWRQLVQDGQVVCLVRALCPRGGAGAGRARPQGGPGVLPGRQDPRQGDGLAAGESTSVRGARPGSMGVRARARLGDRPAAGGSARRAVVPELRQQVGHHSRAARGRRPRAARALTRVWPGRRRPGPPGPR